MEEFSISVEPKKLTAARSPHRERPWVVYCGRRSTRRARVAATEPTGNIHRLPRGYQSTVGSSYDPMSRTLHLRHTVAITPIFDVVNPVTQHAPYTPDTGRRRRRRGPSYRMIAQHRISIPLCLSRPKGVESLSRLLCIQCTRSPAVLSGRDLMTSQNTPRALGPVILSPNFPLKR